MIPGLYGVLLKIFPSPENDGERLQLTEISLLVVLRKWDATLRCLLQDIVQDNARTLPVDPRSLPPGTAISTRVRFSWPRNYFGAREPASNSFRPSGAEQLVTSTDDATRRREIV